MFDSILGTIIGLWAIQPRDPGSPDSVRGGPSCAMGLKLDQLLVGLSLLDLFLFALAFCLHVCLLRMPVPLNCNSDSYELPCGCWELNPGPLEE